jgi:uncharacterized membrane protein
MQSSSIMRSRVTLLGHPVHPMLVAFPITLYAVTLGSLIAYGATRDPFWWRAAAAANVAALVAAVIAAIPGLVDYLTVVRGVSARRTGRMHAIANLVALAMFAACYVAIATRGAAGLSLALLLAGGGMVAVAVAGFHGWSLVQEHSIGVRRGDRRSVLAPLVPESRPASMVATDHAQQISADEPHDPMWTSEPTHPWNPSDETSGQQAADRR